MSKRRFIAALLAALLPASPVLAAACGTVILPTGLGASTPAAMNSLNPMLSNSTYVIEVMQQVLRQLVWFRPDGTADWSRSIASDVSSPDDGLHFVITLHDWRWSDGQPITSADLLFTLSLIRRLGPDYINWNSGGMPGLIASARALDAHRVELTMVRKVNPDWFVSLALGNGFTTMPEHVFAGLSPTELRRRQNDPSLFAVGDGPFRLSEYAFGRHLVLTPNPNWAGPRPQVRRLVVSFPLGNAALQELRTGQLDAATIPYLLDGFAKSVKGFHSVPRGPDTSYSNLMINFASPRAPFLRDLAVRTAITRAIDQKEIVSLAFRGQGTVIHGPVPPSMASYLSPTAKAGYPDLSFDPAASRALLDQAGWRVTGPDGSRSRNGVPLRFEILVSADSSPSIMLTQIVQRDLARVGIEVRLREINFNQLYGTMVGNGQPWDTAFLAWTLFAYPDLHDLYASDGVENFGHYRDATMDRLAKAEMYEPGTAPLFAAEDFVANNVLSFFLPAGVPPVMVRDGLGDMDRFMHANDQWTAENITLSGALACPAASGETPHS